MYHSLLSFNHLKAIVRAETRAHSAMTADDGLFCIGVKIDRAHNAGAFAFTAAYAFF